MAGAVKYRYPFVAEVKNDWVNKQVIIPFTDAPTAGVPYFLESQPEIERARIRALSLYIKVLSVAGSVDDCTKYPVGSTFYNVPSYANVADFFLTLKEKSGKLILQNMPLTRLTYITGLQAHGRLLATDFRNISLTDSFITKRGTSVLPTLPWVLVFDFYYDPAEC